MFKNIFKHKIMHDNNIVNVIGLNKRVTTCLLGLTIPIQMWWLDRGVSTNYEDYSIQYNMRGSIMWEKLQRRIKRQLMKRLEYQWSIVKSWKRRNNCWIWWIGLLTITMIARLKKEIRGERRMEGDGCIFHTYFTNKNVGLWSEIDRLLEVSWHE